jgi:hypothetical protein
MGEEQKKWEGKLQKVARSPEQSWNSERDKMLTLFVRVIISTETRPKEKSLKKIQTIRRVCTDNHIGR